MTPEERLDRLERIAKLFTKAGRRMRREVRDNEAKIKYLIDLQIRNEDVQRETEERFAKLTESQVQTDRRLSALIDFFREGENGNSLRDT